MATCNLIISIEYQKIKTDLSKCACCKDVIYSEMNAMLMVVNGKKERTDFVFCDSCFDAIEKQNPQ